MNPMLLLIPLGLLPSSEMVICWIQAVLTYQLTPPKITLDSIAFPPTYQVPPGSLLNRNPASTLPS